MLAKNANQRATKEKKNVFHKNGIGPIIKNNFTIFQLLYVEAQFVVICVLSNLVNSYNT